MLTLTNRRVSIALVLLLALAVIRLWLLPLPSSFWVDELVTAFVVHYGASHPSFAAAPQVTESIYYWLPRISEKMFGFSEVVYRIPSVLATGLGLFFIFRLANRLIHPDAGWFAVFACFTLRLFNYEAADARPYALGMFMAAASLWYLVRWFDTARWREAVLFVIFAAFLWRVHLVYWPFYLIFVIYAIARLQEHTDPPNAAQTPSLSEGSVSRAPVSPLAQTPSLSEGSGNEELLSRAATPGSGRILMEPQPGGTDKGPVTSLTWPCVALVFAILAALLIPVALRAVSVLHEAKAHVIVTHPPSLSEMNRALKLSLVVGCLAAAALIGRILHWPWPRAHFTRPVFALILAWWLTQPLALFAFSWITGNSVFVDRYLGISLPGAALAATLITAYFLPPQYWKNGALAFGAGVVLFMGGGLHFNVAHHGSDWRKAARTVNQLGIDASTPIILPSPFIEARPPVWTPDYPLPGFLYSYLTTYHLNGKPYLFPFESSPEAERYAAELTAGPLLADGRFVIYGGDLNVKLWQRWFSARPELANWTNRRLGPFGDVEVALFEKK